MTKDDKALYRKLLEEGTPRDEIDRIYSKLRSKGYGEVSDAAQRQQRTREQKERQNQTGRQTKSVDEGAGDASARRGSHDRRTEPSDRQSPSGATRSRPATPNRAGLHDSRDAELPFPPSPSHRRRVNRWAFRNRLLITGVRQRWLDFLTLFRGDVPDYAHPRLIRALAAPHHLETQPPEDLSLADVINGLRLAARRLVGETMGSGREAIFQAYRRRDPFMLEYLSRFTGEQKRLIASLARLDAAGLDGIPVTVAELVRPARELYRLVLTTEQVSRKRIGEGLAVAKDIVLAYGRPVSATQLDDATELFLNCLGRLQWFKRELYPVALKTINQFFEEYEDSPEKTSALHGFAGITDDEILTLKRHAERETRLREQRLIEERKRELDELELEKEAGFSRRFEGALSVLSTIFPGSGIERVEQNRYLLPYFDVRVFRRSLPFDHQRESVEAVAADDPLQPILVLHRIVDNLLASINHQNLEKLLARDQVAEILGTVKTRWSEIYSLLFAPYLRALNAYAKGAHDRDAYSRSFDETVLAHALRSEINDYRAALIRDYGRTAEGSYSGPHLYAVVQDLHEFLAELAHDISQDLVKRDDPIGKRIYSELDKRPFVDFDTFADAQSPDLKPVTRQVKRYVEAKYYSSVHEIPKLSQLFAFDFLRGVVDLYHFLVNDAQSFLKQRGNKVAVATEHERAAWTRELSERSRDSVELLRVRLAESEASGYVDELTGFKNKNYYLKELPRQFADLKQKQRPFCFLLLDLDHFKWVNDDLGHQKGDEVLSRTAAALLDSIRIGHDIGIRYGGEEMLLLIQAPLHNAVLLAERLRHAQQERVATLDHWAPIRELADDRGEPCTTVSMGVARADSCAGVDEALQRADRALYKAKEQRNCVVLALEPPADGGAEASQTTLQTYEDYARKLRVGSGGEGRNVGGSPRAGA